MEGSKTKTTIRGKISQSAIHMLLSLAFTSRQCSNTTFSIHQVPPCPCPCSSRPSANIRRFRDWRGWHDCLVYVNIATSAATPHAASQRRRLSLPPHTWIRDNGYKATIYQGKYCLIGTRRILPYKRYDPISDSLMSYIYCPYKGNFIRKRTWLRC